MTKEKMNKYAYELMVKNNPEEAVKQLLLKDKIIEKTQQSYDEEYNLRHKLSLELSIEKDKVFELSNHLALYSSEETMLKEIDNLKAIINKAIEYIENDMPYLEEPDEEFERCDGTTYMTMKEYDTSILLKILKGE